MSSLATGLALSNQSNLQFLLVRYVLFCTLFPMDWHVAVVKK